MQPQKFRRGHIYHWPVHSSLPACFSSLCCENASCPVDPCWTSANISEKKKTLSWRKQPPVVQHLIPSGLYSSAWCCSSSHHCLLTGGRLWELLNQDFKQPGCSPSPPAPHLGKEMWDKVCQTRSIINFTSWLNTESSDPEKLHLTYKSSGLLPSQNCLSISTAHRAKAFEWTTYELQEWTPWTRLDRPQP